MEYVNLFAFPNMKIPLHSGKIPKNVVFLRPKEGAHRIMDSMIDLYFRPTAHRLLDFFYLTNPGSKKPLLDSREVYMELARLESFSLDVFDKDYRIDYWNTIRKDHQETVASFADIHPVCVPFEERKRQPKSVSSKVEIAKPESRFSLKSIS